MKGLMSVLSKEPNTEADDDSLSAPELEGGPVGQASEAQVAIAGDAMSAMQKGDAGSFADALASFVEMSK